jgi:hypothetical protein
MVEPPAGAMVSHAAAYSTTVVSRGYGSPMIHKQQHQQHQQQMMGVLGSPGEYMGHSAVTMTPPKGAFREPQRQPQQPLISADGYIYQVLYSSNQYSTDCERIYVWPFLRVLASIIGNVDFAF